MSPPLSCARGASAQSSQGGQIKTGRSKLSLRKRRGKKKKETRSSETKQNSCGGEKSSLSERCKEVHGSQCDEAKENVDENIDSTVRHAALDESGNNAAVRGGSSSSVPGESKRPICGEQLRRTDEVMRCSQGNESKQNFPGETESDLHKRKVPIPSFSAFSSAADGNANSVERKVATARCGSGGDDVEERANSDTHSGSSQQNSRRKSIVSTSCGVAAASFVVKHMNGAAREDPLDMTLDSDSDSDLPSPVFRRKTNPHVKEKDTCNKREKGCQKHCGAPVLCDNDTARYNEASVNQKSKGIGVEEKSSICVIEIDESDGEQVKDCNVPKASKKQPTNGCEGGMGKTQLKSMVKSPDEDLFDIPVAKKIADREKELDTRHSDLLRQLAQKPSPQLEKRKRGLTMNEVGRRAKRSKKQVCALCSTCSCSRGAALKGLEEGATEEVSDQFHGLARSNTEVERALISRLKRLEKSSAWFDHLSQKVGRELRRHRSKMISRSVEQSDDVGLQQPRFLADVDSDSPELLSASRLGKARVRKVQGKLFGPPRDCQPTLTQLIPAEQNIPLKSCSQKTSEESRIEDFASDCPLNKYPSDSDSLDPCCLEEGLQKGDEPCSDGDGMFGADKISNEVTDAQDHTNFFKIASDRLLHRLSSDLGLSGGLWGATACAERNQAELVKEESSVIGSEGGRGARSDGCGEGNDIDRLDDDSEQKGDFEQLLNLFHCPLKSEIGPVDSFVPLASGARTWCSAKDHEVTADVPSLSQNGENVLAMIEKMVMNDPVKGAAIDKLCPKWRDNVRYSLTRNNEDAVREALSNVEQSKQNLAEARKRFLVSLQEHEHVLEFFGLSLRQSLRRFQVHTNTCEQTDTMGVAVLGDSVGMEACLGTNMEDRQQ